MKVISSKYLTLLLYSVIPSVAMYLSTIFVSLNNNILEKLTTFTAGLLLMSGVSILKVSGGNISTIFGFFVSILLLRIKKKTLSSSIISSFYFDSISDGLLLGSLMSSTKNRKILLPILFSLTSEMSITSISVANILKKSGELKYKQKISVASLILLVSIIVGFVISKYINKKIINGIGSASMMWMAISFLSLKKIKNNNLNYVFVGLITQLFIV